MKFVLGIFFCMIVKLTLEEQLDIIEACTTMRTSYNQGRINSKVLPYI